MGNPSCTPATGLVPSTLLTTRMRIVPAPIYVAQGTAVPFAGHAAAAAQVAVVLGARSTDLPGSPPRGAPV